MVAHRLDPPGRRGPTPAEIAAVAGAGAGADGVLQAAVDVLDAIRRAKSEAKVGMKAAIERAVVRDTPARLAALELARADLMAAGNIQALVLHAGRRLRGGGRVRRDRRRREGRRDAHRSRRRRSCVRDLVARALAEDIGRGDVTSAATVDATMQARGVIVAKAPLVVAGLDVAEEAFRQLDADAVVHRALGRRRPLRSRRDRAPK